VLITTLSDQLKLVLLHFEQGLKGGASLSPVTLRSLTPQHQTMKIIKNSTDHCIIVTQVLQLNSFTGANVE